MSDQTPPTPAPEPPPAQAVSEAAPVKAPRPRPSWAQVGVATAGIVGVLAIAGIGFAIGRATADDDDRGFRPPGQEQRFDQRGPGGPGMLPPALPPRGQDEQGVPDDSEDDS